MREFAVVGGGIGGCSIAALLASEGKDVVLLEKEPFLGGCASTFTHGGRRYNTGATTLSGYGRHDNVHELFERVGVYPKIIETDPAIVVIQNGKTLRRHHDFDKFLKELQARYPHPKHEEFWRMVYETQQAFYRARGYYYSNASLFKKLLSLTSFVPLIAKFFPFLRKNAKSAIKKFYGDPSQEYMDFIDAQTMIVAQAPSDKVNLLTAILSLGYAFRPTHYVIGGMGALCDALASCVDDVRTDCEVGSIVCKDDYFVLSTKHETIEAKNLIMGTSHFESAQLFFDQKIHRYYERYKKLDNHQSAFVVYLTLKTTKKFYHHYQLIANEKVLHTISKAIFVSFSDPIDTKLAQKGEYSVTASIHVDAREWTHIERSSYSEKKRWLHVFLLEWICNTLGILEQEIVDSFAATPKTFYHYIKRVQLGGNPMSAALTPRLPSNDTPIKGFYQVGDTAYPAQGWPGVVAGVMNLERLLDE